MHFNERFAPVSNKSHLKNWEKTVQTDSNESNVCPCERQREPKTVEEYAVASFYTLL